MVVSDDCVLMNNRSKRHTSTGCMHRMIIITLLLDPFPGLIGNIPLTCSDIMSSMPANTSSTEDVTHATMADVTDHRQHPFANLPSLAQFVQGIDVHLQDKINALEKVVFDKWRHHSPLYFAEIKVLLKVLQAFAAYDFANHAYEDIAVLVDVSACASADAIKSVTEAIMKYRQWECKWIEPGKGWNDMYAEYEGVTGKRVDSTTNLLMLRPFGCGEMQNAAYAMIWNKDPQDPCKMKEHVLPNQIIICDSSVVICNDGQFRSTSAVLLRALKQHGATLILYHAGSLDWLKFKHVFAFRLATSKDRDIGLSGEFIPLFHGNAITSMHHVVFFGPHNDLAYLLPHVRAVWQSVDAVHGLRAVDAYKGITASQRLLTQRFIVLGSSNPDKHGAVQDAMPDMQIVINGSAHSGVGSQPIGMEETLLGAQNRMACCNRNHPDAHMWVGIENGIVQQGFNCHAPWVDMAIVKLLCAKGVTTVATSAAVPITHFDGTPQGLVKYQDLLKTIDNKVVEHFTTGKTTRRKLLAQAITIARGQHDLQCACLTSAM
jgi:non-canonical (house-cleaning) NTP pyrophosphatase